MKLFSRFDDYYTDDPDFNEGHPEDRCPLALCGRPVVDHPGHEISDLGDQSARWPHRWAALIALLIHH